MIVTSGGSKIHPEIPEAEIDACPEVARSVVFADVSSPNLVAVIVPKHLEDISVQERIRRFIDRINESKSTNIIGRVIFSNQEFSRENGFLLPNLKLNRRMIAQQFLHEGKSEDRRSMAWST